jgi:hypothetical protein
MEVVFYHLLDLIEDAYDPHGYWKTSVPPLDFVKKVHKQANRLLGGRNIITYKVQLLKIFFFVMAREEAQDLLGQVGSLDDLERLFLGPPDAQPTVPPPNTGTYLDDNSIDDSIRDIRYLYALGVVFGLAGRLAEAKKFMERALQLAQLAQNDQTFLQRRGKEEALDDLTYCGARIHRALAGFTLEQLGKQKETLQHLGWAAEMELARKNSLPKTARYVKYLDLSYVNYLHVVKSASGNRKPVKRALQLLNPGKSIPAIDMEGMSFFIQALAAKIMMFGSSQHVKQASLNLLDAGIDHFKLRLTQIPQESIEANACEDLVRHSLYLLIRQKFRLRTSLEVSAEDSRRLLGVYMDFVKEVRGQGMEENASIEYQAALKKSVLIMRQMCHQEAKHDDDTLCYLKETAWHMIVEYSEHALQDYKLIAADLYRVLADLAYLHGDLIDFVTYSFLVCYVATATGTEGDANTRDEARLDGTVKMLKMVLEETNTEESQMARCLLNQQYEGLQGLQHVSLLEITVGGDRIGGSGSTSLKRLAQNSLIDNYVGQIRKLNKLLQCDQLRKALQKVLNHLIPTDRQLLEDGMGSGQKRRRI